MRVEAVQVSNIQASQVSSGIYCTSFHFWVLGFSFVFPASSYISLVRAFETMGKRPTL